MFLDLLSLLILYFSIIGFSVETKKIIFNNANIKIFNLDFFYGLLALCLIAIFLNFFFPLEYFGRIFLIIGLILFLKNLRRKLYKINFLNIFLISVFLVFIFKINGLAYDSALYHFQVIKWISNYKISFGLSNLEPRFGINSLWHIFISFLNINYLGLKFVYIFNYLPLIILIAEFFKKEKNFLSDLFLFFSICFIFIFAILHPFQNGVMLNLIGSPEVDTVAMTFFILSLYTFIKYLKEKKIDDINLIFIISSLTLLVKISHLSAIFFAIIIFFSQSKIVLFTRLNFSILLLTIFWFIRSLILSGCLIFPAAKTCFDKLYWSHPIDNVILNANAWTSFSRDTRLRLKAGDFDHTINSFNWVKPWINDYLFNTAFFKAMFFIFIISILIFLLKKIIKIESYKIPKKILFLIPIYLISFYIWFKNPEIRLGYGPLVTITSISITLVMYFQVFEKYFIKYSKMIVAFLIVTLALKNINNINLINNNEEKFSRNYLHIKIIDNNLEIYSPDENNFCYDFEKICVIEKNNKYKIEEYYNYYLFLRS